MASLNHGRFLEELVRLVNSHVAQSDLLLARSALMWLSVAQRPLRAHELWIALQVEESRDTEHLERLLSESAYVDERKAAKSLLGLLGGLISLHEDGRSANKIHVALCDPELRTFLNHMGQMGGGIPERVRCLAFSTAQAHILVASVSMVICSLTTLHLAHVHDETIASSLVLYAWAHWNTHLSLSGYTFDNENAAGLADPMMYAVCTDVLVFLLALGDFVTGPVAFSTLHDRTRCTALVKEVQTALARQMGLVQLAGALVQQGEYCKTLQAARAIFEASGKGGAPSGTVLETPAAALAASQTTSKVETLQVDRLLKHTRHLFDAGTGNMVQCFADVARGLRSLSMLLAQPPLYEELLKEYSTGWSPLDILVNAANWMEAVAGYPYWGELSTAGSSNPLIITDTSDPNYDTALLLLSRIRKDGSPPPKKRNDAAGSQQLAAAASASKKDTSSFGISRLRWNAARVAYKIKSLPSRGILGATYTINDPRRLSARTSSFASFPVEMTGSSPSSPFAAANPFDWLFSRITPYLPRSLHRLQRRHLSPLLNSLSTSDVATSLDAFSSGAFSGGQPAAWPRLKAALLLDGYRAAFGLFLAAALLHHVRALLLPWLGQWMWYTPLDDLRLALSNPDVFLERSLSYSWSWAVLTYAQKWTWDVFGFCAVAMVAQADAQRVPQAMLDAAAGGNTNTNTDADTRGAASGPHPAVVLWLERVMAALKVGYLVWVLGSAEYVVGRGVNTAAWVIAYYKLLAGGDAEHVALGGALKAHWAKVPLTLWQLAYYLRHAVWPLAWASVVCALVGQPGLLTAVAAVVAAVTALTLYRSTFYIALEVGGMFVVGGFVLLVAVLLALEFFDDPLGLNLSTAAARARANEARSVLPQGAGARTQILRRKAALPVRRSAPPPVARSATVMTEEEDGDVGEKRD